MTVELHLLAGWGGLGLGFVSGGMIGTRFYRDEWLGGYGSLRRRMVRLGHIAFIGLGLVNIAFALSIAALPAPEPLARVSSAGFLVGAATMPLCCFLTAYRERMRILFPLPVTSLLGAVVALLLGWTVR